MESYCSRGKKRNRPRLIRGSAAGEAESLKNDVLTVAYHKNDGMYQARMEMPEHTNIKKKKSFTGIVGPSHWSADWFRKRNANRRNEPV